MNLESLLIEKIKKQKISGYIIYDIPRMDNLHQDGEQIDSPQWLGGGRNGEFVFNGYRVCFGRYKCSGGDGWTTVWMFLMPLKCTLENV